MSNYFQRLKDALFTVGIVVLLMLPVPAHAHKVIMEIYVSENTIEGEIGFSDGSMAKDETVEVFNETGTKVGETKTNNEGFFSFTVPQKTDYTFRANLGSGHVAEAQLSAAEITIPDGVSTENSVTTNNAAVTETNTETLTNDASQASPLTSPQNSGTQIDATQIKNIVAEAVRKEVRPLQREIAAYREKNDFQSILGGIGYILGLFGVAFYIAARQKSKGNA